MQPTEPEAQANDNSEAPAQPQQQAKRTQNRAAFGKWQAKVMSGFPGPAMMLPEDISDEDICRQYPNHVDDYVILRLMRKGMGAKAIDEMMPVEAGKKRAGQSHSKIQLRIGTIRREFPDEDFPIPSSRRRPRRVADAGANEGEDEEADQHQQASDEAPAPQQPSLPDATASSSTLVPAQDAARSAPPSSPPSAPPSVASHPSSRAASNHAAPAGHGSLRELPAAAGHAGPGGVPGPRLPHLEAADWNPPPAEMSARLLREIDIQQHTHHELVHQAFYRFQAHPRFMLNMVRRHVQARYDAESRRLLNEIPGRVERRILQNGVPEPALAFLMRCGAELLWRVDRYRVMVLNRWPHHEPRECIEAMALAHVLNLLKEMTRNLRWTIEANRQLDAYANLTSHGERPYLPVQAGPAVYSFGHQLPHERIDFEPRPSIFHPNPSNLWLLRNYAVGADDILTPPAARANFMFERAALVAQEARRRQSWEINRAPQIGYTVPARRPVDPRRPRAYEVGDNYHRWRELLEWERALNNGAPAPAPGLGQ